MGLKLFLTGDTGGSGHGATGLGTVKHLITRTDVDLNFSTHFWAWSRHGWQFSGRQFPDKRFQERMLRDNLVNEDYLIDRKREYANRPHNLEELPFNMAEAESEHLMVKQFDGTENVNLAIGSPAFAERQPNHVPSVTETTVNTTEAPVGWKTYLDQTDELWVPCNWARQACINAGLDKSKIEVVPYGVDFRRPSFNDEIPQLNTENKFTFGFVGRWCNLKGVDRLVNAYVKEFIPSEDDVQLFIKTTTNQQLPLTPRHVQEAVQGWISDLHIPDPPEIGFSTEPLSTQRYWDMLNAFDAFVFPSRAEAIGIAPVQAMGLGIPTVATQFSAMKNYVSKDTAFPVDHEEVPVQQHTERAYSYDEYRGTWGDPDQEHLQQQMRRLYEAWKQGGEEWAAVKDRAEAGKNLVREKYDWETHAETRVQKLEEMACRS